MTGGDLSLAMADSEGDIQSATVGLSMGSRILAEHPAGRERCVM